LIATCDGVAATAGARQRKSAEFRGIKKRAQSVAIPGGITMANRIAAGLAVAAFFGASVAGEAAGPLDYQFFKARVQPIFLTKRPGHAPCVMCHAEANNMLRLEKLPDGQSNWTEEQTRKNFETVSKIVQAADTPLEAKILLHPLAPEAGGDAFHSGGRQFASKSDPNWKIIAQWAQGATLPAGRK
jgi:hypothetical protein